MASFGPNRTTRRSVSVSHSGCFCGSANTELTSFGSIGVDAITADTRSEISPAPRTALWISCSIFATVAGLRASSSVCGSSMKKKSGRADSMLMPRSAWSAPR